MIVAWAALGIGLALVFDLGLGRFAPGATRFLDPLLHPLAAYALRRSQRSAMVVGCVSGLLQDYWTEPRLFGLNTYYEPVEDLARSGRAPRSLTGYRCKPRYVWAPRAVLYRAEGQGR